jgi:hypothetical protein
VDRARVVLLAGSHAADDIYQGAVPALLPFFIADRHYSYAAATGLTFAATALSSVCGPVAAAGDVRDYGQRAGWQRSGLKAACHRPPREEIIMYPNPALSAAQLAIMAAVVVAALAAWLTLVFFAARQPRGTSAAVNAEPRSEETEATVTRLTPDTGPAGKTAA